MKAMRIHENGGPEVFRREDVELPAPGTGLSAGKEAAVVESVKAASDVYAPIDGEVVEANAALEAPLPVTAGGLGERGLAIYDLGDVDPTEQEGATALVRKLRAATWDDSGRKVFTLPVALSIMVFFALCAQCASTLVVIGRETGSRLWPLASFTMMTVLAWLAAMATYQLGTRFLG